MHEEATPAGGGKEEARLMLLFAIVSLILSVSGLIIFVKTDGEAGRGMMFAGQMLGVTVLFILAIS